MELSHLYVLQVHEARAEHLCLLILCILPIGLIQDGLNYCDNKTNRIHVSFHRDLRAGSQMKKSWHETQIDNLCLEYKVWCDVQNSKNDHKGLVTYSYAGIYY